MNRILGRLRGGLKGIPPDSSKGGAVETGCSDLYGVINYPHPLHPPPTAAPCNEYPVHARVNVLKGTPRTPPIKWDRTDARKSADVYYTSYTILHYVILYYNHNHIIIISSIVVILLLW